MKQDRKTGQSRRERTYRTLVLTVALGSAGLYIAGALYTLVII